MYGYIHITQPSLIAQSTKLLERPHLIQGLVDKCFVVD